MGRLVLRPAVVVGPATTVRDAARVMKRENVSSLLVGGDAAIVTERDFTTAWANGVSGGEPVSTIATEGPMEVGDDTAVTEAARLMLNHNIRHLVVTDGDSLLGVVSLRAVLAVVLQATEPGVWLTELRTSLAQMPEAWLG